MGEDRTTTGAVGPAEVSDKRFDTVRKGYDPTQVRAFLDQLGAALRAGAEREQALAERLAAAERRAAHPELDTEALTSALGHEVVQVLASAREAAAAVTVKAQEDAVSLVEAAHAEAARLTGRAASILAERSAEAEEVARERMVAVEAQVAQILAVATDEAEAILEGARSRAAAQSEAAREQAVALVEAARTEGAELIAEARQLRNRVLTDLAKRRRVLHLQVERLRAGRESLTEVVRSSRVAFAALDDGLARAEADARSAAEAAVRQISPVPEAEAVAELEAALVMGRQAELVGPPPAFRRRQLTGRLAEPASEPVPVAEPAPVPVAEPEPAPVAAESEPLARGTSRDPTEPVENLFARLRAAGSRLTEPASTGQDLAPGEAARESRAVPDPAIATESALQRRDLALQPVTVGLARKLKRALQDDQNAILDQLRVRTGQGRRARALILGALEGQREHFCAASAPLLAQAAMAGVELAPQGAVGETRAAAEMSGREEAEQLADALSGALRRRLSQVLEEVEAQDEARTAELVGVAYREWKGERLEGLAADHTVAAFGSGFLAATPPSTKLTWVVDDGGTQCADCDDNALAGPQSPGAAYPTGQVRPPAHPGCRCLLVPS